jgi:hypothetical protein
LAFTVTRLVQNAPHYLDRSATFAAAVVTLSGLLAHGQVGQASRSSLNGAAMWFGILWWIGGLAITVFLPVRSSLYAVFPSVGVAIAAASLCSMGWAAMSARGNRLAFGAAIAAPLLLWPIYHARNQPWVQEAELSARTLSTLQQVADTWGAGVTVVLEDDRLHKPSLDDAFGTAIQDAVDLVVMPHVTAWIEPSPHDASLANLKAPTQADVVLTLKDGVLIGQP